MKVITIKQDNAFKRLANSKAMAMFATSFLDFLGDCSKNRGHYQLAILWSLKELGRISFSCCICFEHGDFYQVYPEPCFVSTRLTGGHCCVSAYRSPSTIS